MDNKKLFVAITVVVAFAAFFLTRVVWPDPVGIEMPSASLIPWFILVGIFEALGVGVGIAFLITSWKRANHHPWVFGSVVWLLVSWWPHDSLHRVGEAKGYGYLLSLELGFHVTLIVTGFILAGYLMKAWQEYDR